MKTVYSYSPETGEYIGTTTAQESPREPGIFLYPANTTDIKQPVCGANEIACFMSGAWQKKSDYRGKTYWDTVTREKHEIKEIGISPEANWTDIEPIDSEAEWVNGAWEIPLAVHKQRKIAEIKQAFNSYVASSTRVTLGYDMQFNESDSIKLEGSIKLMESQNVTSGYLTDAHDETHYNVPLADIKKTQLEMLAAYGVAHARKQELRAQVEAAADKEALDAIVISFGA